MYARPVPPDLTDERLAARIAELAVLRGDFTLRSGRKSSYYLDKYLFETQPDVLAAIGRRFGNLADGCDRIAGPELGGVALAAAAALSAELPFVLVRNAKKGYGTGNRLEGPVAEGDRVLIVEDILTTGGQVLEAAEAIKAAGCKVAAIAAVIDRAEGARANIEGAGYTLHTLFTVADLGIEAEG